MNVNKTVDVANVLVGATGNTTNTTKNFAVADLEITYNNETAKNGVTAAKGFFAAGAHIGIKKKNKDLALIWSEKPATVAAVFTRNVVKAACILWNQSIVDSGNKVKGIVINSGNANACTGPDGIVHNKLMAATFAESLNVQASAILVASTGVIGVPMPIDTVINGIKQTSSLLGNDIHAATNAAQAIMTTDTFSKEIAVQLEIGGVMVAIGGMAKGSGMIHPNMATMLAFVTTDANISPALLKQALTQSAEQTYNMISVDGDTSTNDMLAVLANGEAGNALIEKQDSKEYALFLEALNKVNTHLAKSIVADGEGATKVIEVEIQGAKTINDARKLARSVVSSNLVKTAFFGQDANWGRILAAMGYSGGEFDPGKVTMAFQSEAGQITLMQTGKPVAFDEAKALEILKEKNIKVAIVLSDGDASAVAWGSDLSYDYVRINGAYRT